MELANCRAWRPAAWRALVLVASASTAAAQPPAASLPQLALETYPVAAREVVSRAHQRATDFPLSADAVCSLARLLQAWEQWDGAHQAYQRCLELAPRAFEWSYLDALVLQRMARHDVAAERLRQAVGLAPGYLPARVRLAESLLDTGNLEESRTLFESLAREQAAAPVAEFGIGRIDAARGLHEDAIGHFQRAIALFPEFGSAYYALALSYRAGGRLEEARAALARSCAVRTSLARGRRPRARLTRDSSR